MIEARDIKRVYPTAKGIAKNRKGLRALDGVSLSIPKGHIHGLVGESGCGKSTLARLLLRLENPDAGQILLNQKPYEELSAKEICHQIQIVFQDPYSSLNPRKRIGNIIGLPLLVNGFSTRSKSRETTNKMMELVGLPPRLYNKFPSQLSGGQRQRVAIARALVIEPEVLICDEPTSALDVSVQAQILNLLLDLYERLQFTMLMISHNLAIVEFIASEVSVMYLGRIVEQGRTEALFSNPLHPYTQLLLSSILTPDPGLDLPDISIDTQYPNPLDPPSGCSFNPRCPKAMAVCRKIRPTPVYTNNTCVECHLYGEDS